jgi:hypothetical protein
VLGLAAALAGGAARAQYATSIPFMPWTSQYEEFVYPIVPNNLAIPNQARFGLAGGMGGGNLTQPWSFDAGGQAPWAVGMAPGNRGAGSGRFAPYNAAFRAYDADFNRIYDPNAEVDAEYYARRDRRESLYLQAVSETDPARRAELLRAYREAEADVDPEDALARRRAPGVAEAPAAAPSSPEEEARRRRIRESIAVPTTRRVGGLGAVGPGGAAPGRGAGEAGPSPDEILRRGALGMSGPVQSRIPNGGRQAPLDAILGTWRPDRPSASPGAGGPDAR